MSLAKLLGDYPRVRVLDFLLSHREMDHPLTDVAGKSGVGWSTLHAFFHKLVELGIAKETRRVGKARMFKLNENSALAHPLIALSAKIEHSLSAHRPHAERSPARLKQIRRT